MTEQTLARPLPNRFVLAVTVGGVIGLGILRGPGEIAEVVWESSLYLGLSLLGGLFVLLSTVVALSCLP
jgi:APA family basic amino acid/polyamine antiporter